MFHTKLSAEAILKGEEYQTTMQNKTKSAPENQSRRALIF